MSQLWEFIHDNLGQIISAVVGATGAGMAVVISGRMRKQAIEIAPYEALRQRTVELEDRYRNLDTALLAEQNARRIAELRVDRIEQMIVDYVTPLVAWVDAGAPPPPPVIAARFREFLQHADAHKEEGD